MHSYFLMKSLSNNPQNHNSAVAEEIAAPLQDGKAGSGVCRKKNDFMEISFSGIRTISLQPDNPQIYIIGTEQVDCSW